MNCAGHVEVDMYHLHISTVAKQVHLFIMLVFLKDRSQSDLASVQMCWNNKSDPQRLYLTTFCWTLLVLDTTGHLQRSGGDHDLTGWSCFGGNSIRDSHLEAVVDIPVIG